MSPQPTNPEQTLANSVPLGGGSNGRIGYDPASGEIVLFQMLSHLKPAPAGKPRHAVFTGSPAEVLRLVDDAWVKTGGGTKFQVPNDKSFVVPMGRQIGTGGETNIKIVVDPATMKVTTAYPVK